MKSLLEVFLERSGVVSLNATNSKTQTRGRESPDTIASISNQAKKTLTEGKEAPDRELLARYFRNPVLPEPSVLGTFAEIPTGSTKTEARKTLTSAKEQTDPITQNFASSKKTRTDEGKESPDQEFIPRRRI